MLRNTIASVFVGIICGMGSHAGGSIRETWAADSADPQWAMEQCYKASLAAAVNIYDLRSLGREEAWQTGKTISGNVKSVEDIYRLRSLGRAVSPQIGKDWGVPDDEMREPVRIADSESSVFYRLRSLGREEARQTGVDICKRIGAEEDRRAEYR